MTDIQMAVLIYFVGVAARIVVPYILEKLRATGPLAFDVRYMVGQFIGAVAGLVPVLIAPDFIAGIADSVPVLIFGYGWFATDGGNVTVGKYARKKLSK